MELWASYNEEKTEAGIDEAGRGCLAGPVVAAAVILPKDYFNETLNDSKKLVENQRDVLREQIMKDALAYATGIVDNDVIDEINILNATYLAMHDAISKLSILPDLLLVDGNRFKPYEQLEHHCIVHGDGKYFSIAAASVLAKTQRDKIMREMHKKYPEYQWDKNKGYPTAKHREAIKNKGISPLHRKSFNVNHQLSMRI